MQSRPYASPTPSASQASPTLWLATILAFAIHFIISTASAPSDGKGGAEQVGQIVGRLIGTCVVLLIIVGIASAWKNNKTQKRRVTVFLVATLALTVLQVVPPLFLRAMMGAATSGPPWEYRLEEHGFSLVLPSSGWEKSAKQTHLADFVIAGPSPMVAGVTSVEKQSLEGFQLSAPDFKRYLERRPKINGAPSFQEGETASGNRYVLATWHENARSGNERLYVATSRVWLSNKESTVTVLFEGHGKMLGEQGRAIEDAEFEKQARAICLSVK